MTSAEPATTEQIASAAQWLADNWHVCPQPINRTLRDQFGLSFAEAVKAYAAARRLMEVR
jgi:hypothetical protein